MSAFSILEVLVAVAVLSLIMVLMVQISSGILSSSRIQNQQLDSVAAARRAVDIIESDIQAAIIGGSSTLLVRPIAANQTFLALVADRFAPDTANATTYRCLAVQYAMDNQGQLFRRFGAVNFPNSASQNLLNEAAVTLPIPTPDIPTASGILGLTLRIITTNTSDPIKLPTDSPSPEWAVPNPSTTTYNGFSVPAGWLALVPPSANFVTPGQVTSRALEIWVAALEPQSYRLLQDSGQLATAQAVFNSHPPGAWRNTFDATTGIPSTVKSALRIITKTVPLQ